MEFKDYYKILGIKPDSDSKEIKNAYRRMVNLSHPDKHPENGPDASSFIEIQEAYDVLGNPERRKEYNENYFRNRPEWREQPAWQEVNFRETDEFDEPVNLFNEMISRFFNRQTSRGSSPKRPGGTPDHRHYDDLI